MKYILIVSVLILGQVLQAQEKESFQYQYIKHSKRVPPQVLESFTKKAANDIKSRAAVATGKEKKDEAYFLRHNAYYMHKMLNNGFIYFGDTITNYCEAVLDKLLENDHSLRNKFTVFTVKSPEVNAFMTHDGYMFINLGLLAQIENEAQLASIMGHEIVHYLEEHAISGHKELQKLKRQASIFKPQSTNDIISNVLNYSKDYEYAADSLGLDFFIKAGYKAEEATQVMDILLYSYLPFDEIEIDYSFLEIGNLKIPNYMQKRKFGDLTAEEDVDDSKSTHPNIAKRKKELNKKIQRLGAEGGTTHKLGQNQFEYAQKLARYEISRQMLVMADYDKTLYHNFLMSRKHPNDEYLTLNTAIALSGLMEYLSSKQTSKVVGNKKKVEGNMLSITTFARDNNPKDLGALAVIYCYEAHKLFPKNEELKELFEKTIFSFVENFKIKEDDILTDEVDFSTYFNEVEKAEEEEEVEEDENLSKIERLKKQKSKSKKKQEKSYYRVAFAPYLKEKTFENIWEKALLNYEDNKAYVKKRKTTNKASQSNEFYSYFSANDGMGLGIDKLIVVTPNYTYARTTSKDQVDFASTEKGQAKFNKSLLEVCKTNKVEAEILHPTQFDEEDADKFNDMAVLQQYISERFFHGEVDAYVSNSDRVKEIAKKYDTRYILYTGTFSSNSVDTYKIVNRIQSMIYIVTIPYVLYKFLSVPHETLYYSFIFDIETGQMVLGDIKISKLKNYDSIVWNNLNQIIQKASTPTNKKIKD